MSTIIVGPIIVGVIIGVFVWVLGVRTAERRDKKDAIRDLMTYRGDYSSNDFRRALNKVSITFHGDEEVRKQVRELNEMINGDSRTASINRKIVSLIYDLCRKNGFKGITEYDIDQSFPEQRQIPSSDNNGAAYVTPEPTVVPLPPPPAPPTPLPRAGTNSIASSEPPQQTE